MNEEKTNPEERRWRRQHNEWKELVGCRDVISAVGSYNSIV